MPPKDPQWNRGAPPSVGWWPASKVRDIKTLAWWDGTCWSIPALPWFTLAQAQSTARIEADYQRFYEWRERPASWPPRSRT